MWRNNNEISIYRNRSATAPEPETNSILLCAVLYNKELRGMSLHCIKSRMFVLHYEGWHDSNLSAKTYLKKPVTFVAGRSKAVFPPFPIYMLIFVSCFVCLLCFYILCLHQYPFVVMASYCSKGFLFIV